MFSSLLNKSIAPLLTIDPLLVESPSTITAPPSPPNIAYIPHDDPNQAPSYKLFPQIPPFQSITEICGSPGIGKTQFMMFFCAKVLCEKVFVERRNEEGIQRDENTVQQPQDDITYTIEPDFHILYIDTEGSFSITRFRPLLIHQLQTQHPTLPITHNLLVQLANRIKLQRVIDLDQHLITLNDLEECIKEEHIKLVVYDSIAFFYRTETSSFEWQQLILEHGQKLYQICENLKVCMVLVNQVTTKLNPKTRQAFFAPALGHTWSHLIAHRIFLYMAKDGMRKLGVWKSNFAPIQEFSYEIVSNGIELVDGADNKPR